MNRFGEEFTYLHKDPAFRTVQWIGSLIGFPIWFVLFGWPAYFWGTGGWWRLLWLLPAATVVIGVLALWAELRAIRFFGYAVLDDELVTRSGKMFESLTITPYGRMQKVEVEAGPIMKRYGLASVKFVTASSSADVAIDGVKAEEAERLRRIFTERGEARMEGL